MALAGESMIVLVDTSAGAPWHALALISADGGQLFNVSTLADPERERDSSFRLSAEERLQWLVRDGMRPADLADDRTASINDSALRTLTGESMIVLVDASALHRRSPALPGMRWRLFRPMGASCSGTIPSCHGGASGRRDLAVYAHKIYHPRCRIMLFYRPHCSAHCLDHWQ